MNDHDTEPKTPKLKKRIFGDVRHSWDCKICFKDGYNEDLTAHALKMTLYSFDRKKRKLTPDNFHYPIEGFDRSKNEKMSLDLSFLLGV